MLRAARLSVVVVLALAGSAGADIGKYSVKVEQAAPPGAVKEAVAKVLGDQMVRVLDDKGQPFAEFWFRKEVAANATAEQVKSGLTYRDLEETTLVGVVRFVRDASDYRKQKIKSGVYTLRLGFQPMDGDHQGTAAYNEFCMVAPAASDEKPEALESAKHLQELSTKATGTTHPGVFLLFPNSKPGDAPKLEDKDQGHLALTWKVGVIAGGEKGVLGIALTIVGTSSAA
jgi:hypothetical protein